jgi:rubrerythrin
MMNEWIRDLIEFAIEKEQEAVDFYSKLALQVKDAAIATELHRLADMERMHKAKLQKIDPSDPFWQRKHITDLKIADYVVESAPSETMSFQDVLSISMKRELAAQRLYVDLARSVDDPDLQKMMLVLAEEESAHKHYFETLWDQNVLMDN